MTPARLTLADIGRAVRSGRGLARTLPGVSVAYAAVFALFGLVLLIAIGTFGLSPLALPFAAFRRALTGLWAVALICAFLFLIWITDAGILYSFTIGGAHLSYDLLQVQDVLAFELWGSLMGSVLAFMIFTVAAFSVPLIYEGRAGLVEAVNASVRTVFGNFPVCLAWGLVLGTVIILSVLLLPLLLFTLPVMSYASFFLYRTAFPPQQAAN